ncbi:MAG TPA: hypothetical protein VLD17_08625 [Gemmatimonadaceae bacterium]|nr:hypothetical protein [Gemmatimonadaceae bacterium]
MHLPRSLHTPCVLAILIAPMVAVACSSESVTAPTVSQRAIIAARLDSARVGASAERAAQLLTILQEIALGAPIGTVRLSVNGKTTTYPMVASYDVQAVAGRPFDSLYLVDAWSGAAADTIWVIAYYRAALVGFVTNDTALGAPPTTVTGGVTPSAAFGSCVALRTQVPQDVTVPFGFGCQRQNVATEMSGRITVPGGTLDVTVPSQTIAGVRLLANAP